MVIYKKLAAARKVSLPPGVSQEDQTLFAGVDQPDPMDVLAGIHDPGNGGEPASVFEKAAAPAIQPRATGKHILSWDSWWASKGIWSSYWMRSLAAVLADPHTLNVLEVAGSSRRQELKLLDPPGIGRIPDLTATADQHPAVLRLTINKGFLSCAVGVSARPPPAQAAPPQQSVDQPKAELGPIALKAKEEAAGPSAAAEEEAWFYLDPASREQVLSSHTV